MNTEKEFEKCFACGQANPIGLKLRFEQAGKTAQADFTPSKLHQGWSGIVHGGIINFSKRLVQVWMNISKTGMQVTQPSSAHLQPFATPESTYGINRRNGHLFL